MAGPTPLFLLAPSRSGSTLLQRLLSSHSQIATTAEPMILLPPLTALDDRGAFAVWNQWTLAQGIEDFTSELPGGRQAYLDGVASFARTLYAQVAPGATYFLDKTPRYHLVAERIFEAFPDARFVFLWRNPLAIAASYIDTVGGGRWNLHHFANELYDGVAGIADAHQRHEQGACAVRFEDLVNHPERELERILRHLELPPEPGMTSRFTDVELRGHARHDTSVGRDSPISREPLDRWRTTMATPVRRHWAARYLRWLGDERLAAMGYRREELLAGLAGGSRLRVVSDAARSARGEISCRLKSRLWRLDARVWR